nr:NAD+ synthase [Planctomycetota bacterium]
MRVALGQFNAVVGDLAGNANKMRSLYARAVEADADLLVFPELAVCGYPPEDLLYKKHFLKGNRLAVEELAVDCPDKTIIVGFAEDYRGKSYNAAAVLQGGNISTIYRKSMLPNYGVFDEQRYFFPGGEPVLINVNSINIALTICFDIW